MAHEKNEEQILREMQETRVSLTEKLETLEKKVVGTVENATSAVNETVDAIKDSVHETVASVNESVKGGVESVKGALDLPAHVQEHPWLMLGGSIAAGYVLGTMLAPTSPHWYAQQPARAFPPPPPPPMSVSPPTPVANLLAPEIAKLKGLALGVLFGAARELIRSSVPEHIGDKIEEIVDAVTKKAGGVPVPSADFDKWTASADDADRHDSQPSGNEEHQHSGKEHGNGHTAPRRW